MVGTMRHVTTRRVVCGHLQALQWACKNGCEWNNCSVWYYLVQEGHLHVLQWARQDGFGDECFTDTCAKATEHGQLHALKGAHQNGYGWDCETCSNVARRGHLHVLVQWARQNGCAWDDIVWYCAVQEGHLQVLIEARRNGFGDEWFTDTCAKAAEDG